MLHGTRLGVGAVSVCVLSVTAMRAQQKAGQPRVKPMKITAQDYVEIQELLHKYMFALDTCETGGYGYADLYTPDGYFTTTNSGRRNSGTADSGAANAARASGPGRSLRWQGREELARAGGGGPNGCPPNSNRLRGANNEIHLDIGLVLEPTVDGAKGRSYLLMIEKPSDPIKYAGWYEDEYVKTPAGWRFKSRNHVTDFSPLFDPRSPGFQGRGRGPRGAGGDASTPGRGERSDPPARGQNEGR